MEISCKKSISSYTILMEGKEGQVWSTSTTVADFLTQQGITLTELDRVEPALEEKVIEKMAH